MNEVELKERKTVTLCTYCLSEKALTPSDGFKTDEDFYNHLEEEHDLVVRRENETGEQAEARVKKKNSRIGTKDCRCPDCKKKRGE